jgi:hypothetical protein
VSKRLVLDLRAQLEDLEAERDAAVTAWEDCCCTVSELRAERDDAISENRRLRRRLLELEELMDRRVK